MAARAEFLAKLLRNLGQVVGYLRNQRRIGMNGDGRLQRQPTGMFAENLDDADLPCRLGRLPGTVERLCRVAQGTVEAEGQHGRRHFVLDRLRHGDDGESLASQLAEDAQGAAFHNRNDGVDLLGTQLFKQLVRAIDLFHLVFGVDRADVERVIPSGRAQDGSRRTGEVLDDSRVEMQQPAFGILLGEQQPIEAVANAHGFPAQFIGRQDHAGDDGVEARHVAAAQIDGDSLSHSRHRQTPRF